MDRALWACELPESSHDMLVEGAEIVKSGRGANNGGFFRNSVTSSKVMIASMLWSRLCDY